MDDVIFLATLAPVRGSDQLQQLENQLAKQHIQLARRLIYGTVDGQQHVQVSHALSITLPTDRAASLAIRPKAMNGGWGNRFLIPSEPQNPIQLELPKERRTNMAASLMSFFSSQLCTLGLWLFRGCLKSVWRLKPRPSK